MASPEEALRALAVMHNYAPEEYKVCLGEGNISITLSVLILSHTSENIFILHCNSEISFIFSVQECCGSLRLLQFSPKAI